MKLSLDPCISFMVFADSVLDLYIADMEVYLGGKRIAELQAGSPARNTHEQCYIKACRTKRFKEIIRAAEQKPH